MHLFYIDDSDEGSMHTFCAVAIPAERWRKTFDAVKAWRQSLKLSDKILVTKEFHATEFVSGRGRLGPRIIPKGRRCAIFREALTLLSGMNHLLVFAVAMNNQEWAFERLLNRINRTMLARQSYALLISDQGKEAEYTKLVRRMAIHNPIPSKFGTWFGTGADTKNIPTDRLIEDPVFRPSDRSYLLQMADFCAFALLRFRLGVPPHKQKYEIDTAFKILEPICVKAANPKDPLGIIC